jgi:dehydrogenase/reductase SDR family protein 4
VLTRVGDSRYLRDGAVSSIGAFEPEPIIGGYTIMKTALIAMGKVAAKECEAVGIRVNCIAPGVIKVRFRAW